MTKPRTYGIEALQEQIREVDASLSQPVTAFLIGGGAMSFAGLKAATKDIDIVVEGPTPFNLLTQALKKVGYSAVTDLPEAYVSLGAAAYLDQDDAPRWDIYVRQVCNRLLLSPGMIERSIPVGLGMDKLELRRVDPADVFIFKSITDREADQDDMEDIFAQGLAWQTVLEEMQWQTANSDRAWSATFHATLREFSKGGRSVPILEELSELVETDVGQAHVLQLVDDGTNEKAAIMDAISEDAEWVEAIIDRLVQTGRLTEESGRLTRPK